MRQLRLLLAEIPIIPQFLSLPAHHPCPSTVQAVTLDVMENSGRTSIIAAAHVIAALME
jgi:hypothetical protein